MRWISTNENKNGINACETLNIYFQESLQALQYKMSRGTSLTSAPSEIPGQPLNCHYHFYKLPC